ncbi:MAG: hypothetical protein JXR49_14505 [Acidobacteria bacterium]|nr:hypothetical protein [Acidobacteriota bacterium]
MDPYKLLERIAGILENLHIPYLVTGSVAAMAFGEPRMTNDIDVVAAVGYEHVDGLMAAFPEEEFYISEAAIRDAVRHQTQFNIIHPASGMKIDVIIRKKTRFNDSRFSRFHRIKAGENFEINFAAPEDIILMKMQYYQDGGSEKHLRDISGILKISGSEIDKDYVAFWAERLHLMDVWNLILNEIDKRNK